VEQRTPGRSPATPAGLHLNLIESSRRLSALDPGTSFEVVPGGLFAATSLEHPVIGNAAFRCEDEADPTELLERAREFFGGLGRGFALWARAGVAADDDLLVAAGSAGIESVYEMPEMVLRRRVEKLRPPPGAELRRVETEPDLLSFWDVAGGAYASLGFPPELFAANRSSRALLDDPDAAAFLALLGGEPVAIALTIVTHGVAGIYWVGTLEGARGSGLGRAVTAAATNAGFDLGAEIASLQASHMGRPVYEAMGYETIYDYRLLLSPSPAA
jgi:ribosomal protein S18 acetylase RimI-like enzyme